MALLLGGGLAANPTSARGDGDPASDVLLGEAVFYPYTPPVSPATTKALNAEMAAAGRAHFPLKVALIASPVDLGVIPELFGKPQRYADFLDQEISFQGKQALLVVMAAGYGVVGLPPAAVAAAAALPKPAGATSEALAKAAIVAVGRLARAAGHTIPAPASATPARSSGSSLPLLVGVVVVALVCAGALIAVRRRPRAGPG